MEEETKKYPYMSLTINAEWGEEEEIKRVLKARDLCSFIWDFQQKFKEKQNHIEYKMGEVEKDSEEMKKLNTEWNCIDKLSEDWFRELEDHNISLDELWS